MNTKFVVKESFIDFEGKTHKFVIAAIKVPTSQLVQDDAYGVVSTSAYGLKIGVSICNPEDEFDEKLGVTKAVGRANKSDVVLLAPFSGQLSENLIHTFLIQEVEYIKSNPEKYIKGYNKAKDKYTLAQKMNDLKDNFTDIEKIVVENIKKNPAYLDNVNTYINYLSKCKK